MSPSVGLKKVLMAWSQAASRHRIKLLVLGSGLGTVGLLALALLLPTTDNRDSDFDPERFMPPQSPLTPEEIKPAHAVAASMNPSELVIGVSLGGLARAYPVNMLTWPTQHTQANQEVLNDELGGVALVVTWCELCHSGIVYSRDVDQQTLTFGASGQLWKGNLVMVDQETGTLWSQFIGQAKQGRLRGRKLRPLPAVKTDWQSWFAQYPESTVAMLDRNSRRYQTEAYAQSHMQLVLGLAAGEIAKAWSLERLQAEPILNDEFDGQPVLVVFEAKSYAARVFKRRLDDRDLTFRMQTGKLMDEQTKSAWDVVSGRADSGPLAGKILTPLPGIMSHQASWLKFYPSSSLVKK
jgi:hypothetical protein